MTESQEVLVDWRYINPSFYVRSVRRLYFRLNGPAPLNDYPDYDEYWDRRRSEGRSPGVLHRYRLVALRLPAGAAVLDIGCGDGAFGSYLKTARPDCRYFGVDISGSAIDFLRKRGLNGKVIRPDESIRAQIEGSFDVVTAMEVLEHVHDAERLMHDILQLTRCIVVVTIPNAGFIVHRLRLAVFGRFPVTTIVFHMKEHIRFWTYKDFLQWSGLFGLTIKDFCGQLSGSWVSVILAKWFPSLFASQVVYFLEAGREGGSCESG